MESKKTRYITKLHQNDILVFCGKGSTFNHQGNTNYASIIIKHQQAYQQAQSKTPIINQVISQVKGRFLRPAEPFTGGPAEKTGASFQNKKWQELSKLDVRKKVRNSLAYIPPSQKRQLLSSSSSRQIKLQENDIICGLSKGKHAGTFKYRTLIKEHSHAYKCSNKMNTSKSVIVDNIISQLSPGRFVQEVCCGSHHEKKKKKWEEISMQDARNKVRYALNKCAPSTSASTASSTSSTSCPRQSKTKKRKSMVRKNEDNDHEDNDTEDDYDDDSSLYKSLESRRRRRRHRRRLPTRSSNKRKTKAQKNDDLLDVDNDDDDDDDAEVAESSTSSSHRVLNERKTKEQSNNDEDEDDTKVDASKKDTEANDEGRYMGGYKDGKYHGRGKLWWDDGEYYEGDFVDGTYHGKGKYIWPDDDNFEGGFINNHRCGDDIFVKNGIIIYSGTFANGSMHGKGSMKYPNGYTWIGDWEKGRPCGGGICIYSDGRVSEEEFNKEWLNPKQSFHKVRDSNELSSTSSNDSKKPEELDDSSEKTPMAAISATDMSNEIGNSADMKATTKSPADELNSPDDTNEASSHTTKRKDVTNEIEDDASPTVCEISTCENHSIHPTKSNQLEFIVANAVASTKLPNERKSQQESQSQKLDTSSSCSKINSSTSSTDTVGKRSILNNEAELHEKNETVETAAGSISPSKDIIACSHLLTEVKMHSAKRNIILELRQLFKEGKISEDMKHVLLSDIIDCRKGEHTHPYSIPTSSNRAEFESDFIHQCQRRYKELTK